MAKPTAPHPVLSDAALRAICEHAQRQVPRECCGVVSGPKDQSLADQARVCENIQDRLHAQDPATHPRDARTAYNFDTKDLFALEKSLRSDTPVKIIYHSHVDVGAYFSDTDQAAAQMFGEPTYPVEYVVVDVTAAGARGAKQFTWSDAEKKYVEIGDYSVEA